MLIQQNLEIGLHTHCLVTYCLVNLKITYIGNFPVIRKNKKIKKSACSEKKKWYEEKQFDDFSNHLKIKAILIIYI